MPPFESTGDPWVDLLFWVLWLSLVLHVLVALVERSRQ